MHLYAFCLADANISYYFAWAALLRALMPAEEQLTPPVQETGGEGQELFVSFPF